MNGRWPTVPWRIAGEVFTARIRLPPDRVIAPPQGIRANGSAVLVWCGHWAQTPVGPYSELVLAVPGRIGARTGLSVVLNIVTSVDARVAGQDGWGLPRRLGTLRWLATGSHRELTWDEGGVSVVGDAGRLGMPWGVFFRALQRRADGAVVVPIRATGWSRSASMCIDAPAGSPFAPVVGTVKGRLVAGRQVILRPARVPSGWWRTLSAPRPVADPGFSPG